MKWTQIEQTTKSLNSLNDILIVYIPFTNLAETICLNSKLGIIDNRLLKC